MSYDAMSFVTLPMSCHVFNCICLFYSLVLALSIPHFLQVLEELLVLGVLEVLLVLWVDGTGCYRALNSFPRKDAMTVKLYRHYRLSLEKVFLRRVP
jgi:hypothetical protein